nr:hypothetical protein [Tanacetum cinerariifolium]
RANQDNSLRINRNARYESQRSGNVAGARETLGSSVVQKFGIQCYNCKEYRHVVRECQTLKRAKDAAYHREKMLLCKQEEARIQLNAEQVDWKDDTDDESDDQELEAHYIEQIDQNDEDADLAKERELLASLIEKLKCEIDETKNRNTLLETSNKVFVEKLKSEIEDFKNKNKCLTEANNKLSKENDLLYADYKKSKAELKRRDSIEYASEMKLACAKVRGCYNDNLALMLSPESDEVIRLEKESRSKLSDIVRPFDYAKLNSLYDLFVPQREKSSEQHSVTYQLETQKTQFVNEIDRLSREYYYADHMNAILGVYTELDEGDKIMHNDSQGKKKEVEDHRRSVKLSKNKTSVTACNDSLNAKTMNVKSVSAMCDKCVLIDKHDMCVLKSFDKPLKKTVASESNNKPRNFTRKLYERVSKTCSWWYPKVTPSGYIWKPKCGKENVNPNVSMPLGKASRTANVMDTMTSRSSIVSNTPLSSISFVAHRDCPIYRRLWVLKAHDEKSQASN